ncbi:MAG TPA: TonB family protein [Draconibacterium sp.]|nr:TonB family protein [Draconibacterium sp.]
MKKYVIFLVCLMFSMIAFGQDSSKNENTPPEFRGFKNSVATLNTENSALVNNYLKENLVCPKRAAECGIEGTETVQFTVTKSGDVKDFQVINSVCHELDKEVIRVLKTTNGMWSPGVKNGNPTAMINEVTFVLSSYNESTITKHFTREATRYFKGGNKNFLVKNNPEKAVQFYNKALNYLPNDEVLLSMRGLCHYALGDKESAKKDWNRIVALGETNALVINYDIANIDGYSEMKEILANK